MALQVASLEAVLELENRKFEKSLKQTESSLDDLEKALEKATKQIDKMGNEGRDALGGMERDAQNLEGSLGSLFTSMLSADPAEALTSISDVLLDIGADLAGFVLDFDSGMRRIEARTGATGEELRVLGDTAIDVYKNNFGESIGDAIDAVISVNQVLEETGDIAAASAQRALTLRDVFGIDIPESLRAVRSGVESFGRTSEEIFDMMTTVIQNVGDPAGDLADTVNEYSIIFAQAGFSAEEFFGILQAGVRAGARNFDQVADTVKEFVIRIQDGSDTTRTALGQLFDAVGEGSAFFDLQRRIDETTDALEANEDALKSAEGAYAAQEKVVNNLERALSEAKRKLDELARPNLAGFDEFEDKIFELEQQSRRAELALLDLEPDSSAYESTEKELDRINTQLDKLTIQRDLIFEEQFRALEKAAKDSTEQAVTFEQALQDIADQKDFIGLLEENFRNADNTLEDLGLNVGSLLDENDQLNATLAQMKTELEGLPDPVQKFLDALASGAISPRDAMSEVIQMLRQVDDQLLQNQIGVALFGTKWEDVGPQVVLALDPATAALEDFQGATDAAADAVAGGLGASFEGLWRMFETSILPLGEMLLNKVLPEVERFVAGAGPIFETFTTRLEAVGPFMDKIDSALRRIEEALGLTQGQLDPVNLALTALEVILNTVILGVIQTAEFMDGLASSIETVSEHVGWAVGKFEEMGRRLNALKDAVPDWLVPGSPTPFETGLKGIRQELSKMPDMSQTFGFNGVAPVAGGGAGGGSITINMGGQSMSFSNDQAGINQAMAEILRLLRGQLAANQN